MTQNIITAGAATISSSFGGGNDGTLAIVVGPAGSQVTAISVDATGQVSLPTNTTNKLAAAPGTAPVYGVRAWCSLDGTLTGTNAPRAGGNFTSFTRTAAGLYSALFTTPMPDANYAVSIGAQGTGAAAATSFGINTGASGAFVAPTVNGFSFAVINGGAYTDVANVLIVVVR